MPFSDMPPPQTASIQAVKGENYRTIGYIEISKSGVQIGMDQAFRKVAYFDPVANVTRDSNHNPIGIGNALADILADKP